MHIWWWNVIFIGNKIKGVPKGLDLQLQSKVIIDSDGRPLHIMLNKILLMLSIKGYAALVTGLMLLLFALLTTNTHVRLDLFEIT